MRGVRSASSASFGRLTMNTGRALRSTTTCWPGWIWLMSMSTGPAAASVAASGFIWSMSGHRVAAAPTVPTAAVAR